MIDEVIASGRPCVLPRSHTYLLNDLPRPVIPVRGFFRLEKMEGAGRYSRFLGPSASRRSPIVNLASQ